MKKTHTELRVRLSQAEKQMIREVAELEGHGRATLFVLWVVRGYIEHNRERIVRLRENKPKSNFEYKARTHHIKQWEIDAGM